jgi:hypothetical protein
MASDLIVCFSKRMNRDGVGTKQQSGLLFAFWSVDHVLRDDPFLDRGLYQAMGYHPDYGYGLSQVFEVNQRS